MQSGDQKDKRRQKSAIKLSKLAESLHSAPMILAGLAKYIHDLGGPNAGQSIPVPRMRYKGFGLDWCNHLEAARRILSVWMQHDNGISEHLEPTDRYRLAKGYEYRIKNSLGLWVLDAGFRELNTDLKLDEAMIRYAQENLDLERVRQVLLRPAALVLAKMAEAEAIEKMTQPAEATLLDQMPSDMRRKFKRK
jgi:hypothetical protein